MQKYNTLHYVLALLKAYGIRDIVASPGSQNSTFNYIAQEDSDFKCYSVIDERAAVYVAIGITTEIQNPTVITCTGATAARNYMSGMSEAYYRELPIIALTFYNPKINKYSLEPQYTDRSVSQNDIKEISIHLPEIKDDTDKKFVLISLNAALSTAKYKNLPVHIDCPSAYNYSIKTLPTDIWITKHYTENFTQLKSELKNKKFAIFMGEHKKFSKEEENIISEFAVSWNIPVFCDHTSNYHGKNKILISQFRMLNMPQLRPDVIIDMGGISGVYNKGGIFTNAEVWRVVKNYRYGSRHNRKLTKILIGSETNIFKELTIQPQNNKYFDDINQEISKIEIPELPLSMPFVALNLSQYIPANSSLHLAILTSLDSMDYFKLPETIDVFSNVGAFGIDGPLSTVVGQSLVNPHKQQFCITGDLAFFYDMNILGNRHINKNLKIILVNNNKAVLFRLNRLHEDNWGEKTDILVGAAGHNKGGAKGWAESCGFKYLTASTKDEFTTQIKDFCNKDYNAPVLFEVFTDTEDEKLGMRKLLNHNNPIDTQKNDLCLLQKVFSVKNEISRGTKHKVIRVLGAKIKLKVKK